MCKDCNKFLRWLPNPTTKIKAEKRSNQIDNLCNNSPLNNFERIFLQLIKIKNHLTNLFD